MQRGTWDFLTVVQLGPSQHTHGSKQWNNETTIMKFQNIELGWYKCDSTIMKSQLYNSEKSKQLYHSGASLKVWWWKQSYIQFSPSWFQLLTIVQLTFHYRAFIFFRSSNLYVFCDCPYRTQYFCSSESQKSLCLTALNKTKTNKLVNVVLIILFHLLYCILEYNY